MLQPICAAAANPPEKVADFIAAATKELDVQKLNTYMLPMDVEVVRKIPLSHSNSHDFWAWHYDQHGIFTVRSCDKFLVDTKLQREA